MLAMQAAGHEIANHTKTHANLSALTTIEAQNEIAGAKADLEALGVSPITNIAYPYGAYNDMVKQITQDSGHAAGRSVDVGYNIKSTPKYALKVQNVEVDTTIETIRTWIDIAAEEKTWLILCFHQIDSAGTQFGTTPAILQQITQYLATKPVQIKTVHDTIPLMNP
jgi:peptidoglycan/xylan/chitin deacetylase (PgdA/CDA1 family)